jgi:DNA-directed RNA polymerase subunit L
MELSFANVEYSNVPDNKNKIVSAEIVATNVSVSLANSIRRVLLSNLPNVGFNEKLINIKENTSAAHNELIKHRISLLPIYRDSRFKILSYMDNTTNKRVFTFAEDSIIPIFTLNKQNQNNFLAQQINIEDVMSNEFEVFISKTLKEEEGTDKEAVEGPDEKQQEREMLDIEDFFESDYFTNDYIHLLLLKSNPNDKENGEKLVIEAQPDVGISKQNASYSPISTVSYFYEKDVDEMLDIVFEKQFQQANIERQGKGLEGFSEKEKIAERKSFDLLESARVYKQNQDGECNIIHFGIESIGVYSPIQAFMDGLHVLELKLIDLLNHITFTNSEIILKQEIYSFYFENKVGYLEVNFEDHTLGNLITDYMNRVSIEDILNYKTQPNKIYYKEQTQDTLLDYCSYRIIHPLEETIKFKMKINETNIQNFNDILTKSTWSATTSRRAPYIIAFYKTSQIIIDQLQTLQKILIDTSSAASAGTNKLINEGDIVREPTFIKENATFIEKLFYE